MRQNTLLIGAGIASFVVFAVSLIPARTLTNQLPEYVRFGGVEGSLWNGHIRSLDINGWQLNDMQWTLKPGALLLGRLSASIATRVAGGEFNADVSVSVFGAISVNNMNAIGPIAPIAARLNLPVSGGHYEVQLDELNVADAWPVSVIGTAQVTGVPLGIMGGAGVPTGHYIVTFDSESVPEDGRFSGALTDGGGPIEVTGDIVLTPPANYEVRARVKARPGASADITQALVFAGPVESDGRREVTLSGSL